MSSQLEDHIVTAMLLLLASAEVRIFVFTALVCAL
jgi:hypothetical protein